MGSGNRGSPGEGLRPENRSRPSSWTANRMRELHTSRGVDCGELSGYGDYDCEMRDRGITKPSLTEHASYIT